MNKITRMLVYYKEHLVMKYISIHNGNSRVNQMNKIFRTRRKRRKKYPLFIEGE